MPASDIGSSVSIISGDEIARRQSAGLGDILRGTPSTDVVRSGGFESSPLASSPVGPTPITRWC